MDWASLLNWPSPDRTLLRRSWTLVEHASCSPAFGCDSRLSPFHHHGQDPFGSWSESWQVGPASDESRVQDRMGDEKRIPCFAFVDGCDQSAYFVPAVEAKTTRPPCTLAQPKSYSTASVFSASLESDGALNDRQRSIRFSETHTHCGNPPSPAAF